MELMGYSFVYYVGLIIYLMSQRIVKVSVIYEVWLRFIFLIMHGHKVNEHLSEISIQEKLISFMHYLYFQWIFLYQFGQHWFLFCLQKMMLSWKWSRLLRKYKYRKTVELWLVITYLRLLNTILWNVNVNVLNQNINRNMMKLIGNKIT